MTDNNEPDVIRVSGGRVVEALQAAIDDAIDYVATSGDDTSRWSKAESADFYEAVALHCSTAARALREELAK